MHVTFVIYVATDGQENFVNFSAKKLNAYHCKAENNFVLGFFI